MNNVIDFINVNRDRYLDELKALLAIPSISALPEHAADVKRCAVFSQHPVDAGQIRQPGDEGLCIEHDDFIINRVEFAPFQQRQLSPWQKSKQSRSVPASSSNGTSASGAS